MSQYKVSKNSEKYPEIVKLSSEDAGVFANALLNPPNMNDALKRAYDRREKLLFWEKEEG